MKLDSIEVVEDRTAGSRCDQGFLTLARLRLQNVYDDGSRSDVYSCDVVSRPGSDAVVAVLYEVDSRRRVRVLLRRSPRAPIYLRRHKRFVHPDPHVYQSIEEVVAGMVEADDGPGDAGLQRRAAIEAEEEVGLAIAPAELHVLGGESFASPGMSDEKVYYCAAAARLDAATHGAGDGSVMEEHGEVVVRELGEAIAACRSGAIPDMKTEIALLRLADAIGYLPQLDCFADELPPELRDRFVPRGVNAIPLPEVEAGTDRS